MKREQMLTEMIRIYGVEHEAVIQFTRLVENPDISDKVLRTILLIHQECPLKDEDE